MRTDLQIPAHLRQQVAADFFVPILEGRVFFAEAQAAVAALSLIGHELASDLHAPRQLLYSPLEFGALHDSILGQMCPHVKLKIWLTPFSETVALERVVVKLRMFGSSFRSCNQSGEIPSRKYRPINAPATFNAVPPALVIGYK